MPPLLTFSLTSSHVSKTLESCSSIWQIFERRRSLRDFFEFLDFGVWTFTGGECFGSWFGSDEAPDEGVLVLVIVVVEWSGFTVGAGGVGAGGVGACGWGAVGFTGVGAGGVCCDSPACVFSVCLGEVGVQKFIV